MNLLLDFRFNADFLSPITLMLLLLILGSGKNIEYSQAFLAIRRNLLKKIE